MTYKKSIIILYSIGNEVFIYTSRLMILNIIGNIMNVIYDIYNDLNCFINNFITNTLQIPITLASQGRLIGYNKMTYPIAMDQLSSIVDKNAFR